MSRDNSGNYTSTKSIEVSLRWSGMEVALVAAPLVDLAVTVITPRVSPVFFLPERTVTAILVAESVVGITVDRSKSVSA